MHEATVVLAFSFIVVVIVYVTSGPKIRRNGQPLRYVVTL